MTASPSEACKSGTCDCESWHRYGPEHEPAQPVVETDEREVVAIRLVEAHQGIRLRSDGPGDRWYVCTGCGVELETDEASVGGESRQHQVDMLDAAGFTTFARWYEIEQARRSQPAPHTVTAEEVEATLREHTPVAVRVGWIACTCGDQEYRTGTSHAAHQAAALGIEVQP